MRNYRKTWTRPWKNICWHRNATTPPWTTVLKKESCSIPIPIRPRKSSSRSGKCPQRKKPVSFPRNNARCVSVDTISIAPEGRNKKRGLFKGKTELVKFRCTAMEKKLLKNRAKHCGLTLSEYFRRVAFEKKITERLT